MADVAPCYRAQFLLPLGHKEYEIRISEEPALELWLQGCLRKRDENSQDVLYVWTNVELFWEEHRYVEARYHVARRHLHVTVNRETVLTQDL